jgi:Carboxypeptidase regulatory-like domain/TonB dependent receptor-like, beta-barrel
MKRCYLRLPTLVAVLLLWTAIVAQSAITLSGTVEDPTGAAITKARLTLINKATGEKREAVANGAGSFGFENIPPGQYSLQATAKNYETVVQAITVGAQPLAAIKIKMKISIEDEVTIYESSVEPVISPGRNADALKFDDDLLRELPAPGQNILPVIANFLSPAALGAEGVSLIVDGAESGDLDIPASAIKRVRINRNPYSAEFRRPGKGRVEVTTADGSRKRIHGGAALFSRNSHFDARNPFAQVKPDLDRRLFEAFFSGPLPGMRASFFLSGERLINDESAVVNARTLAGPVIENILTPERRASLLGRLQFYLNDRHKLEARYDFNNEAERNRGVGGFHLSSQAISAAERRHRFYLSERAILSSSLINDLRFIFERREERRGAPATGPAIVVNGAFTGGSSQIFRASQETILRFQDFATYPRNRQTLRVGVEARPKWLEATEGSNLAGTFEFSSLDRYALGEPFVFRINQGHPAVSFSQHEVSGFFQDEMQLRPNLNLTLGLRYDWQSNIHDRNNFAPRLAFAYAPGSQKTVLRSGAGIFYEHVPESVTQRALLFDGARIRELVISNPSFPGPFGIGQASLLLPSVVRVAPDIRAPYVFQAGFSIERALWSKAQMAVEYQTLRGLYLLRSRNLNATLPETRQRPDPNLLNINQVESSASMRSNALSVTFRGSISSWFKGMAQYTLSHTTGNTSGPFVLPANNYDLRPELGRADFDQRHQFTYAGTLELPRSFRVGLLLRLASGKPFDITTGLDDNLDTVANDRPPGVTRNAGRGPGLAQLDLRLTKLFSVPRPFKGFNHSKNDSPNLEISIDLFNALNHTNFTNFIGVQSSPFFGQANSALPARTIQLSTRYRF